MWNIQNILKRASLSYEALSEEDPEKAHDLEHLTQRGIRRLSYSIQDGIYLSLIVLEFLVSLLLVGGSINEYIHRSPSSRLFPTALYSPAEDVLDYRVQRFHAGFSSNRSVYQGPPNDELDDAWEALYSFGITSVPQHQAARMPNLTVPIPDEPGHFVVELDVFHELHCLNMIRRTFYPEHYKPMTPPDGQNATTDNDLLLGWTHIDHCIDSIRQSLMCMADVSTIVYVWSEEHNMSLPNGQVMHTCRDFEKIQDWARARQVEKLDTKTYVPNELRGVIKPF